MFLYDSISFVHLFPAIDIAIFRRPDIPMKIYIVKECYALVYIFVISLLFVSSCALRYRCVTITAYIFTAHLQFVTLAAPAAEL